MGQKLIPWGCTFAEALKVEQVCNQALIDVLVAKGTVTYNEPIARIQEIKKGRGIVVSK